MHRPGSPWAPYDPSYANLFSLDLSISQYYGRKATQAQEKDWAIEARDQGLMDQSNHTDGPDLSKDHYPDPTFAGIGHPHMTSWLEFPAQY